jgi:hypothetical protein
MKRHVLVTLAAILALGFTASLASAQCAFEHPKKAKKIQASLVQAFVSCGNPGGNTPNTTTESGTVPTCKPPETFNEDAGSPADGWEWDETKGQGSIAFKAANKVKFIQIGTVLPGANPASPLNPAGDTVDLVIQMKLKGVIADDSPAGATGSGTLSTVARATLDDRMGGDMTVIDFPAAFPFDLVGGQAKLKTSANALLNSIGQPGLPPCSSIEVVDVTVEDENTNPFARMGTFLPLL